MKQTAGLVPTPWATTIAKLTHALTEAVLIAPRRVVVVLSPFLTVEEAFALGSAFKKRSELVRLVLGPVPIVGADDKYPKDVKGRPVEPTTFTIRAEKCPNRRGVEQVLQQLQGEIIPFADAMKDAGSLSALYFAGGYPDPDWVDAEVPNQFTNPSLVIVQDLFRSKLTARADFVLPATTAFEKDGTFVNHAGLAQSFPRAAKPGAEVRTELQLAFDVAERRGLATVAAARKELAAAMPAFAGLAATTNGKKLELATV